MVAPLLLAAGIEAGGSLLGGLLQSGSANKAAKQQEQLQREAIAAQQRAAAQVGELNAPGVAAYGAGLNALTGRLGLPTQGVADAVANQGGANWSQYMADNPDVMAEYQQEASRDGKSQANLRAMGIYTPEDYARYHYENRGKAEGRAAPTAQAAAAPEAPVDTASGGSSTNALTGSFGNTADPTWTAPDPFTFNINEFVNNPAYKFALEQGTGQVLASKAATGALNSGAALKELQDRGQKTAYGFYDQERDTAYNQWLNDYKLKRADYESDRTYLTNRYDRNTDDLYRYVGVGQNALNATGNALTGAGNATATGLENIGNTQAGNALAQGNIWSGIAGDLAGIGAGLITGNGSGSKNKNSRV